MNKTQKLVATVGDKTWNEILPQFSAKPQQYVIKFKDEEYNSKSNRFKDFIYYMSKKYNNTTVTLNVRKVR